MFAPHCRRAGLRIRHCQQDLAAIGSFGGYVTLRSRGRGALQTAPRGRRGTRPRRIQCPQSKAAGLPWHDIDRVRSSSAPRRP
jgi:hypothetical protein